MKSILTTFAFFVFCFCLKAQQPGTLDYSFGDSGKVVASTYEGNIYSGLLQPDGKTVIGGSGGYYKNGVAIGGALFARYTTEGNLDLSFGDSGRVVSNIGESPTKIVYALALQKDGKIVAALRGYNTTALVRINADGSADESFGKDGLALGRADGFYSAGDMVNMADGRIAITGTYKINVNQITLPFITCFKPDGSIDESFGEDGTAFFDSDNPTLISSIAVTKEGKIIIGGRYFAIYKTILLRFTSNGMLDKTFGKNGVAEMSFERGTSTPDIFDIAIAKDNRIVAVGGAYPNNKVYSASMASRFLEDGTPDSTFGTNGYTLSKYGRPDVSNSFKSVAVQDNGETVASGSISFTSNDAAFATVRYENDGIIDSTFGTDGIATTEFSEYELNYAFAYSVFIQSNGKIVASGYGVTKDSKYLAALARYNGDNTRRQQIITRIRRYLQHHGITWQTDNNVRYYTVQRSVDGGVTYQPVAKLYTNHQSLLSYEEATTNDNAMYRVAATAKDGSRSFSNSLLLTNETAVKLFPNPVRSTLQVQGLPTDNKTNITVTDLSGNVRTSATATGGNVSINASALKPGNYLLKLQSGSRTTTKTFVKE